MKVLDLDKLFILGQNLRWMRSLDFSQELFISGTTSVNGIGLIESLKQEAQSLIDIEVSQVTSNEMLSIAKSIENSNRKDCDILLDDDKNFLETKIPVWIDRIRQELFNKYAVFVDSEHNLNPEKLLNGASTFFSEEVWKKMTPITKRDLEESVRCLLFKLPTPAGILALRGTESELRNYYEKKTKKKIIDFKNWGTIITDLKKTDAKDSLIGHLDYLRINLRNKLSHPDAVLEQLEAENIFGMIVTTITEMIKK